MKVWAEPVVYAAEGVSGTKNATKGTALQRLLPDARDGLIYAVIILSLDRLGRKTRLVLDLVEERTACSAVVLVSCKEALDTEMATGKFALTMFASLAQLERDVIAERTTTALQDLSKRGVVGGKLPYGHVRTPDGPVVDAEQAIAARYIFGCRKRGDSLRVIADKANARDVVGPCGGRCWATSVREVLANGLA
jgi:DNA invertase Pin-like site-specific DNA recombinase